MPTPVESPTPGTPGRGRLIVIEGIDGTGKSTLVRALAMALQGHGCQIIVSAEPTRGPYGRKLRELAASGREGVGAEEEAELFLRDRQQHVEKTIAPGLDAGCTILLDRYYYSTIAYQGARGIDPALIKQRNCAFAPEPHLLVILELPVSEALERIATKRGTTPDHYEEAAYLENVSRIYSAITHPNLLRLDAHRPTEEMVKEILDRLSIGKD